ncbi:MAG: hypothetical protein HQL94_00165 [Magnetococcales bacterium]|nr:hypothetical protein [Magnetococcales bacterium]MBF0437591.1 hypothetical protein [Magnetococcales bacterium]
MIKNLLFFILFQPEGLFTRMRAFDLFRWALVLQFIRWESTALTTMVTLYREQSSMLLPVPFAIDPNTYRFFEIFLYGPYGLLMITAMAYIIHVHGAPFATTVPLTMRKAWTLLGFCFFGPWLPSLCVDSFLIMLGFGGPEFIIPWHVTIVAAESLFTAAGLRSIFGLPRPRALALGALSGGMFLIFAGSVIR